MLNNKFEGFYEEVSQYMLSEFKTILESVYSGDIENVENTLKKISNNADIKVVESEIFQEIGKFARELHNDIKTFVGEVRPELEMLSDGEVSIATNRLQDVIKLTEAAANSTLDATETVLANNSDQTAHLDGLNAYLHSLPETPENSKAKEHLKFLEQSNQNSNMQLMEIMTAQEFQDRVGQTIKKVIALVENVENRLVSFVGKFGSTFAKHQQQVVPPSVPPVVDEVKVDEVKVDESIPTPEEEAMMAMMMGEPPKPSEVKVKDAFNDTDATVGQDDIDDLLAGFGF